MKQISWFRRGWVVAAGIFLLAGPAHAGLTVGAELHPLNFFILPGGTGLNTKSNFGTGAVFAGFSAGGYVDLQAYLSQDNTGTISGTGSLFGSTGTFDGKFKVLSYGAEIRLAPPAIPIYFKAGIGLCNLKSDLTYTVAGVAATNPFGTLEAAFEAHGGLGLGFKVAAARIFAGLDVVIVKIKSDTTSTTANLSSLVYFRPNIGVAFGL